MISVRLLLLLLVLVSFWGCCCCSCCICHRLVLLRSLLRNARAEGKPNISSLATQLPDTVDSGVQCKTLAEKVTLWMQAPAHQTFTEAVKQGVGRSCSCASSCSCLFLQPHCHRLIKSSHCHVFLSLPLTKFCCLHDLQLMLRQVLAGSVLPSPCLHLSSLPCGCHTTCCQCTSRPSAMRTHMHPHTHTHTHTDRQPDVCSALQFPCSMSSSTTEARLSFSLTNAHTLRSSTIAISNLGCARPLCLIRPTPNPPYTKQNRITHNQTKQTHDKSSEPGCNTRWFGQPHNT